MRQQLEFGVLLLVAFVAASEAAAAGAAAAAGQATRPNIVFVLTDDQRADAVGYAEKPLLGIETPHIDQLAAEGARFDNMFVTTSLCSPSRASFLSGLYAHAHGVTDNFTDFPHDLPSFPRALQAAGYATAYIGKWHMGEEDDSKRPGFDYWASHRGQGKYYDTEFNVDGERRVLEGYYTRRVTDLAVQWLEQRGSEPDEPFLLILGHKAPHGPFVPERAHASRYDETPVPYPASAFDLASKPRWVTERLDTWHGIYGPLYGFREKFPDRSDEAVSDFERFVRAYTATINSVDDSVGAVRAALEGLGVLDDTIFVFSSDNGFLLGEHGMIDKRTMHEESIRVPLVVRYPPRAKAGTVVTEQVLSVDLAPSLLELTGADPLPSTHGLSWAPLLAGDAHEWRTSWYYAYDYEAQFPYTPNVRGVRTGAWKYVRYPHGDGGDDRHVAELYDLRADPGERSNLAAVPRHAERVRSLRAELDRLMRVLATTERDMPIDGGIKEELPDAKIR